MSDLISRQQAIDAIKDRYYKYGRFAKKDELIYALEGVPPAQLGTNLAEVGTDKNVGTTISRQQAIDALKELTANGTNKGRISGDDAVHRVEMLPPVTPKQRTGKWIDAVIPNDNGGLPVQVCDQCNTFFPLAYTGGGHHFCPNCGAKMEGDAE